MNALERRAKLYLRRPSGWRYASIGLMISIVLAGLLTWAITEFDRSADLRDQLVASYERRASQISLLSRLKDVETIQRGYLLTHDPEFLSDYDAPRQAVDDYLAALAQVRHPDVPPDYAPQVIALARAKLEEMDRSMVSAEGGAFATAREIVRTGRGKRLMDQLRIVIGTMIARETELSRERLRAFTEQRDHTQQRVLLAYVVLVLALAGFLLALWRTQRGRFAALVEAFEADERNATILDSTADALLILDEQARIDRTNAATRAILGYADDELVGIDFLAIVDLGAGAADFRRRIGTDDARTLRSFFADCSAFHQDGRRIPVDVSVGTMSLSSGGFLVVSLRDMSERKRIERVKDELTATVSHELRTPLTSVVGSLSLLRAGSGGDLPAPATRLITIAEDNARRLIRLVNDMLDLDRIASGALRLTRKPVDLRTIVAQASDATDALARDKDVRIASTMPDDPVIVNGDGERLLQVMVNLLSNAIRFAPAGSAIEVEVMVRPGGVAFVSVNDRGPGIPAGFRDRIFGRFEQAARTGGTQGAGLGLAISREIIVRHDGNIWFEDRRGGGTRFTFALECIGDDLDGEDAPSRLLTVGRKAVVAPYRGTEGPPYEHIETAEEALEALKTRRFAAVLVDADLPPGGGLAFAEAVRSGPASLDTPILVVAPQSAPHGELAALDVVDLMQQPIDPDRMSEALAAAVRRSGASEPVILHLDGERNLLDVVAAGLAPSARIVTATDLTSARALLDQAAPDVAILDLKHYVERPPGLVPFLTGADGMAIPTIVYAGKTSDAATLRIDPMLIAARGTATDLDATVRRALQAERAQRTEE